MSRLSIAIPAGRGLDVVGLGEISLDRLLTVDGWPEPGGKLPILASRAAPGGQIATAILACARLGLRAALVGSVGADAAAELALADLAAAGVDLASVVRVEAAPTRSAHIVIDGRTGARAVLVERDPRLDLATDALDRAAIESARILLVDATDPDASLWAARVARGAGIPVVLDADTPRPGVEALARVTDFPVVTREFAEEWGGTGRAEDGLKRLVAEGAELAVATCGSGGAIARHGERALVAPAVACRVTDTTGAGDAFHAGFIAGVLEGGAVEGILAFANGTAAISCEAVGAQAGLPTRAEVEARLASGKENRDEST